MGVVMFATTTADILDDFHILTPIAVGSHDRMTPPSEAHYMHARIAGYA